MHVKLAHPNRVLEIKPVPVFSKLFASQFTFDIYKLIYNRAEEKNCSWLIS